MADLLTTETLARWTQKDPAEVAADPLALEIIDKLSQLVCYLGGHSDWTLDTGANQAPIDIQMIVLAVAKRSYENPTQVTTEGSVGPIGGDSHVDTYALFMEFTDTERATITKYNPDGDPDTEKASLRTVAITGVPVLERKPVVLYVPDNLQEGLENSQDPRPWMIPLFNPSDPGDPNNYDDDFVEPDGPFANGGE